MRWNMWIHSCFDFINKVFVIQSSSAISSADLFGHGADNSSIDLTASDLINRLSFQVHRNIVMLAN